MVETQYNCVKVVPATLAKYLLNPTQFDTEYFLNPSRMDLANAPFLWVTMLISWPNELEYQEKSNWLFVSTEIFNWQNIEPTKSTLKLWNTFILSPLSTCQLKLTPPKVTNLRQLHHMQLDLWSFLKVFKKLQIVSKWPTRSHFWGNFSVTLKTLMTPKCPGPHFIMVKPGLFWDKYFWRWSGIQKWWKT